MGYHSDGRTMPHWLSNDLLFALGIVSVVLFIGTLIVIPIVLVRLPVDYFHSNPSRVWLQNWHPAIRITGYALKNALGIVFLLAGLAMLVLPGQGILTVLLGISMIDFPGKRRLERALLGRPAVLRSINKVREKFSKPPLREPDRE